MLLFVVSNGATIDNIYAHLSVVWLRVLSVVEICSSTDLQYLGVHVKIICMHDIHLLLYLLLCLSYYKYGEKRPRFIIIIL